MKYLLILSSGLEFSDGMMTDYFVRNGLVQEGNRLMEPLVRDGNFLIFKIVGIILCAVILWGLYQRFSRVAMLAVSGISVFYGLVIAWNVGVVFG